MPSRLVVSYKIPDARGWVAQKHFQSLGLKGKIKSVFVADSYLIDARLKSSELKKVGQALANPLIENFALNSHRLSQKFNWVIEVGFLPGVTDNVGFSATETISDLLKRKFKREEKVYFSQIFFVSGKLNKQEIHGIAESLYNPLIQRVVIKNYGQYQKEKGLGQKAPKVILKPKKMIAKVNLNVSDADLARIGKLGILNSDGTRRGPLALSLDYMKAIQAHFISLDRNPTDLELEAIGQTWSEHCKHTIFADPLDEVKDGLFKTYIKRATEIIRQKKGTEDFCVSVFSDNSGAVKFDDQFLITHKVETHNTPSALDPFGGAITGIVGVNRDTIGFGLGAKPIMNTYGYCFGHPKDKRSLYRDAVLTQKMLSPRQIMLGVIKGVNVGGNCSGIPTPLGFMLFEDRFRGKPLVFVGTVGLIPKKSDKTVLSEKKAKNGDYIVMVGGKVGQDGIHGATFSSEAIDSGSPATAVQIGDPITQKKFSDALIKECRDLNLYSSITDNGAGGLSSSVAEMAKESGGCLVWLDKVPVKYPGLEPWKIWISESQERMTLAVPKNKWQKLSKLLRLRGVEASIIGVFTNSGRCQVKYKKQTVMDLTTDFLHYGLPKKQLASKPVKLVNQEPPTTKTKNFNEVLLKMLGRLNLTSNEFVSTQYDHEVQAGSVIKPLQGVGRVNGDVAVIKPVLSSNKGIVVSNGIYPTYSDIDTYHMAAGAIDTAIRNAVAAGANISNLALLDNFCWSSSNDPERLYQLKQALKACFDFAIQYETPFISGKDSMFNDFSGFDQKGHPIKISIPPTLLITSIGVIDDINKTVSIDSKFAGDLIYVLGETKNELGASEYYEYLSELSGKKYIGDKIPQVDALRNRKLYVDFERCVKQDLVASSVSVGRGGLAYALCRMAVAGRLGFDIDLKSMIKSATTDEQILFSETQGRLVVTINPANQDKFEQILAGNSFSLIGKVTKTGNIKINGLGVKAAIKLSVREAEKSYKSTFKNY